MIAEKMKASRGIEEAIVIKEKELVSQRELERATKYFMEGAE